MADQGYEVYLVNNRGVVVDVTTAVKPTYIATHPGMKVKQFGEQEYWQWSMDDMATQDVPAAINFVTEHSQSTRVHYVGHSQGNAQMSIALTVMPDLKNNIATFTMLAPAVFTGGLTKKWPLTLMIDMGKNTESREVYNMMFGEGSFVPAMDFFQAYVNSSVYSFLAYQVFASLFSWTDELWQDGGLKSVYKNAHFMFTPKRISAKLIYHWCICASRGRLVPFDTDLSPRPQSVKRRRYSSLKGAALLSFREDGFSNASSQENLSTYGGESARRR